jgi:general stress protein 26|tara:strand:+ start:456 stop:1022 length:567 start_codon:yes stop_codon:yes gene_type:complete
MEKAENHEAVSIYNLDANDQKALLLEQKECVLNWATQDDWPMGVIHSYIYRSGKIWITAGAHRHRISALRRNPKTSVVITSKGTSMGPGKSITIKGKCQIHDDKALKEWFYPEFAKAIRNTPEEADAFEEMLDSPLRVVLEITPEKWITYDGAKMREHTQGTLDPSRLAKPLESDSIRLEKEKMKRNL